MKNQNMLDSLYNIFQEKLDYRLDDQELKKARADLMEIINDPQAECAVLDYGIAYERAGFRNGFRIAAQILSECLNTGNMTENIPEYPFGS